MDLISWIRRFILIACTGACLMSCHRQEMRLERKYPIFRRVAGYMAYIKWSRIEVADNADFEACQSIFTVNFVPDKYKDTTVRMGNRCFISSVSNQFVVAI